MNEPELMALRAFVAVAREGGVSRAAERLHLTQPAVSLQIKALQDRTHLQLFSRAGRGLVLTRDGAALLPQAEKVLTALHDFAQSAMSLRATLRGLLRVGTILDPEFTRLGGFLKQLVEDAPQIETELSQHMSGDVLKRVSEGSLDVGFYLATPVEQADDRIVWHELTHFHYLVLAPTGWGPQVLGRDWKALAQLPWIVTPEASAHHRMLQAVMQPLGIEPRRAALVDQEASMLDLVRSGVGLSLARDTIAMREVQSRGLVVADRVQLASTLCFIHQSSRAQESVIAAAVQALAHVWK